MTKRVYTDLVRICSGARLTISTGESCTGGLLGSSITDVPGASEVYLGGVITYSNKAKRTLLGVKEATLKAHGAVSRETATEMAEGCLREFGSTISASITGIAGPTGGTPGKPVGTVFIAIAGGDRPTICEGFALGDMGRGKFKAAAADRAAAMLLGRARGTIVGGEVDGPGLSA